MTREDIIRMAREAGWSGIYTQWREPDGSPDWTPVKNSLTVPVTMDQIERFAALVVAAERNECAAIVDANAMACHSPIYRSLLQSNADAIRARGKKMT